MILKSGFVGPKDVIAAPGLGGLLWFALPETTAHLRDRTASRN